MKQIIRRQILAAAAATLAFCAVGHVNAEDVYPKRTITLVVPYAPGGTTDIAARLVSTRMSKILGQSIVVTNRGGGAAIPGTEYVANSPPDGYTLLLGTSNNLAGNVAVFPKLPYDPVKSFSPIGMLFLAPSVLMVNPSVPAKNVSELIALVKKQPNAYGFASGGIGSSSHFAGELMNRMTGVKMTHVPYRGDSESTTAAIGGHVPVVFCNIPSGMKFNQTGQLRALGVTSAVRVPTYKDVPTIAEQGLKGFDLSAWFVLMAPANTPQPIIRKLNDALNETLRDPSMEKEIVALGGFLSPMKPDELGSFVRSEIPKWSNIAIEANIQADTVK
jgi:tripartite-type tricarboxylate transporter receptor subunit TctC